MNKIIFCRDEIIRLIKLLLIESKLSIAVNSCNDPLTYIRTLNPTSYPLILVSYKSSLSNSSKWYPGVCVFEIYFLDIKQSDKPFDLMELVYIFFNYNPIQIVNENGEIITGQKLIYQDQSYFDETNEHVIYSQRYNLLIPTNFLKER